MFETNTVEKMKNIYGYFLIRFFSFYYLNFKLFTNFNYLNNNNNTINQ